MSYFMSVQFYIYTRKGEELSTVLLEMVVCYPGGGGGGGSPWSTSTRTSSKEEDRVLRVRDSAPSGR